MLDDFSAGVEHHDLAALAHEGVDHAALDVVFAGHVVDGLEGPGIASGRVIPVLHARRGRRHIDLFDRFFGPGRGRRLGGHLGDLAVTRGGAVVRAHAVARRRLAVAWGLAVAPGGLAVARAGAVAGRGHAIAGRGDAVTRGCLAVVATAPAVALRRRAVARCVAVARRALAVARRLGAVALRLPAVVLLLAIA